MLVKIVSFMTENHASPERYRSMADLGIFYEEEQMKKIFILILVATLAFSSFAQGKTVEQMNGFDWVTMSEDHQGGIIRGFYLACSMMIYMSYEINEPSMSQEQLRDLNTQLNDRFLYSDTVGAMVSKLSTYYASPANRKFAIFRTIPFLAGKEWWNRQTGKVEPLRGAGPGS